MLLLCVMNPISRVVMFLRMASTWFYGLRDLPERFFAQIVVKVVEVCNDLFVLLENVIAEKIHKIFSSSMKEKQFMVLN